MERTLVSHRSDASSVVPGTEERLRAFAPLVPQGSRLHFSFLEEGISIWTATAPKAWISNSRIQVGVRRVTKMEKKTPKTHTKKTPKHRVPYQKHHEALPEDEPESEQ